MITEHEKKLLQSLQDHEGYKVLIKIEQNALDSLARKCLMANLEDPKELELIKKNKIYAKARSDFLKNTESHLQEIYTPQV